MNECWFESDTGAVLEGSFWKEREDTLTNREGNMKWISVKDRWPEYVQGYKGWAFGGGYQFEAEYDDGFWTNLGGEEMTHWRPLPPNPKLK